MTIHAVEFSYSAPESIQLACLDESYSEALHEFKLAQEFFDESARLFRITASGKNYRSLQAATQGLQSAYNAKNDAREVLESYRTEVHAKYCNPEIS